LQNKAHATEELLRKKLNETKGQFDAKVNSMQEQVKNARERRKARMEKRINEVKQEYKLRTEKLKQASKLVGQALASKELETV
jgi:hypothetical protein